jgi:localization factor PodJL
MTSGAPWSVKGIDPKAREIAKDLARRSGMTLGEWLNQVILEDEAPLDGPRYPSFGRQAPPAQRRSALSVRPVEEAFRITDSLDRLSARIEDAEQRAATAIGGINQTVASVMARLDGGEQEQAAMAARFEGAVDGLRDGQARVGERLDRVELEAAQPKTAEALKSLESALTKVAAHIYEDEKRASESFDGLRQELDGVHERLETAFTEDGVRELVEQVIARLTGRLEQAELRTSDALRGLEASFAALDERLQATEARPADTGQGEQLSALAASLTERMDSVRAEMAENIRAAAADGRFEKIEQALAAMGAQVNIAEQRSAGAIEKMGREVLRMADTLARNVQDAEQRSNQAIEQAVGTVAEQVGGDVARVSDQLARSVEDVERRSAEAIEKVTEQLGGEVARIAETVEQRLSQADGAGAQALERLGGEIARITERLTERISNAERRSAQAIDDVGDQVARVTERLQDRQERVSLDLSERIRLSEERTAKLLDEARGRIDQRLAQKQPRAAEAAPAADTSLDINADPTVAPFGGGALAPEPQPGPEPEAAPAYASPHAPQFFAQSFVAAAEPACAPLPAVLTPAVQSADVTEATDAPDAAEPVGASFDADDDFLEPAQADFDREALHEPSTEMAPAPHDDWLRNALTDEPRSYEAHRSAFDEDNLGFMASAGRSALEPASDAADEIADELIEEDAPRPRTTRELIEQARAAARSAPPSEAQSKAKDARGDKLFSGFSLGGKKKRVGTALRTALFVSGATAATSVALAGYVILADKPHGAAPERVIQALGMQVAPAAPAAKIEVAPHPLAAVALSPHPIASPMVSPIVSLGAPSAGDNGAELYSDAVRRIEAKDRTGLAPLQKAANQGYAPAQFYLAKLYEDGQSGLTKDLAEARRWTERAAEGGDRKAMHNLALYDFEGVGGSKNLSEAAQWFRRAADLGLVDSQYNLARLYEEGFGVSQNPAEAYKWYLIAGRSGDAESRMSALRIKSELSPDAQSAAERAALGFQTQEFQPVATQVATDGDVNLAIAQRALTKLGFYQGPSDGASSPALVLAMAAYQRSLGLPATGALDPTLTQRLQAALQ